MFLVKPVTKLKEPSIWIAISAKKLDTLSYYFQHGVHLTKQCLHSVKSSVFVKSALRGEKNTFMGNFLELRAYEYLVFYQQFKSGD